MFILSVRIQFESNNISVTHVTVLHIHFTNLSDTINANAEDLVYH